MTELDLSPENNPYMRAGDVSIADAFLTHLRAADLFWISQDMTALAMHAGEQLASARWATVDRPSAIGVAVFEGGLGMVNVAPRLTSPVEALAWGPGPGGVLIVWHLVTREAVFDGASGIDMTRFPPLLAVREARLPVTSEPVRFDDLPAYEGMKPSRPLMAALAASWHLMQQPKLVERTVQEPARSDARALRRADMPDAGVTLVALRRQYTPQDRDPDAGSDGRRYRHRWIVSGHWREYRSDRYSAETRAARQWIPSHVKGPDGAPLLSTERVNVWRR